MMRRMPQVLLIPRKPYISWLGRITQWACWIYPSGLILGWIMMRLGAERWWMGTMLLYGPRWLWAIPLPLLVLLAARLHPRGMRPLALALFIVIWPMMDLCLPWRRLRTTPPSRLNLHVLTCNVHQEAA